MRPVAAGLLVAFVASVRATSAQPQAASIPVAIRYAAPPGCPDAAAFVTSVRARSSRIRGALPDEPARGFRISIEAREPGFEGTAFDDDGGEAAGRRRVPGASCETVVSALALIVAVSVDPDAALPAASASAPPPAAPVVAPRDDAEPASAPESPVRDHGPARHRPSRAQLSASGGIAAMGGIAPRLLPAPELGIVWTSPGLRLGAAARLARSGTLASDAGSARIAWYAARLDACAPRFVASPVDSVELWPCALVEIGALHAAGSGTQHDRTATRLWLAPGLGSRLSVMASSAVRVELAGAVEVPLVREQYLLSMSPGGDTEVHEVPALLGWGGVTTSISLQ